MKLRIPTVAHGLRLQSRRASGISYPRFLEQQLQQLQFSASKNYYSTQSVEGRYKEKLLQKAKREGLASVAELKDRLKEEIEVKKKELNKIDPLKELEDYEQRMKMSENNIKAAKSRGPIDPNQAVLPFKTLDTFLKVDKLRDLSPQEIEFLWRARWTNKNLALNAVVPQAIFAKMLKNVRSSPAFVLPLPRQIKTSEEGTQNEQGLELHYIQWQIMSANTIHCMMTSLAEFKLHKEFAKPHTTFQFHQELVSDKGIVLMNGQIEQDSNVSLQDAQLLLLNVQRFYGAMGENTAIAKQRVQLLHDFTKGSPNFSVDLLIKLAQSMEN
ncbi:LAMI_0G06898g1_1 [Lachancea mirantina]|uniref:LAMI_0G06898g1_1 n=1 Tax=Lachancea mirantina TaxID=1230905 RepID=A0A1G4K9C4_9SACH|nr:LAMI_0G06898g1_1 [Lachancea mirantina]